MWDSLGSATIDTNIIVQVRESKEINVISAESHKLRFRDFLLGGKDMERYVSEGGFVLKSENQFKITGGYYLKNTYKSYSELLLTLSVAEVAAVLGISSMNRYARMTSPKSKLETASFFQRIC